MTTMHETIIWEKVIYFKSLYGVFLLSNQLFLSFNELRCTLTIINKNILNQMKKWSDGSNVRMGLYRDFNVSFAIKRFCKSKLQYCQVKIL